MAHSSSEDSHDAVAGKATPEPDNAPEITFHVFVSFRGEDIREGFLSHLKQEFPRKQINAFLDYKLQKGDEIWPSLVQAIRGSYVSVIIFSKEYASSRWCLNELAEILDCRKKYQRTVIPVFYKVEPTNVRHQRGSYGDAFNRHEKRYDLDQVHNWRNCLQEAADLSGIELSKFGEEAEQIQEIVKNVDHQLMKFNKHPLKAKGLIGIDKSIAHIESLLREKTKDVRIIGIWGMPGIGKTAIAAEVFKKLSSEYEGCCFLENVRDQIARNGTTSLKETLFSTLLEDVKINTRTGLFNIERRIGWMKVLIVLDDVNSSDQPEKLFGTRSCFGPGSRIIITTRDKQVLVANDVDDKYIHKIGKLKSSDALELFRSIAFKHLEMEHYELSRRVVNYANGIPLVLKSLGKLLRGKDKEVWESHLEKLKRMPNHECHNIMRLSYDDLDRKEQEFFLDLAYFFSTHDMKVDFVKSLLKDDENDDSVSAGLERLKDMALITIPAEGYINMDDIIEEMASEIVRQESKKNPGSYSRLWDPNEVYEALKNDKGIDAVRSIRIKFSENEELKLERNIFARMSKLRFLKLENSASVKGYDPFPEGIGNLPDELRYLSLRNSFTTLPEQFSAEKLVILDMSDSLWRRPWKGVKNLVNLKEVRFRYCQYLQELPDFTKAINLELLCVRSCHRLTSVHPSIFSLGKLTNLDLYACSSLTRLSNDTHLSSLSYLNIGSCDKLTELSVTSENMTEIDLSRTPIKALPPSFSHQKKLQIIDLSYSDIERLPLTTKNLTNLQELDLRCCRQLWILPELPPSVETLTLRDCELLKIVLFPSTATKQFKENRKKVEFWNCYTLDKLSLRAIELNAQINMMKFAYQSAIGNNYADSYNDCNAMYVYPGRSVPEWLKSKNQTEDYIIIDHSTASASPQSGFIFCFILREESDKVSPFDELQLNIIINDGENEDKIVIYPSVSCYKIESYHVCVMYDQRCSHYLNERAKNRLKLKISVVAWFTSGGPEHKPLHRVIVKEFGVCQINTSVYQKFIQQMESHDEQNKLRLPSWIRRSPKP